MVIFEECHVCWVIHSFIRVSKKTYLLMLVVGAQGRCCTYLGSTKGSAQMFLTGCRRGRGGGTGLNPSIISSRSLYFSDFIVILTGSQFTSLQFARTQHLTNNVNFITYIVNTILFTFADIMFNRKNSLVKFKCSFCLSFCITFIFFVKSVRLYFINEYSLTRLEQSRVVLDRATEPVACAHLTNRLATKRSETDPCRAYTSFCRFLRPRPRCYGKLAELLDEQQKMRTIQRGTVVQQT